jgi:hypothetical protein
MFKKIMDYRKFYIVGLFDKSLEKWPHFFLEEGRYLSVKNRVCSEHTAKQFETKNEAIEFYKKSKKDAKFKCEILSLEEGVKPKQPKFDENHPLSKISRKDMKLFSIANDWFHGKDVRSNLSKSTFFRYKKRLLEYGIDISKVSKVIHLGPKPKKLIEMRSVNSFDEI